MDIGSMKKLDLSRTSVCTPLGFAGYSGPTIRWIKRLAFDKVGVRSCVRRFTSGPPRRSAHVDSGGRFIGDLDIEWLVGPAYVVDMDRMGVGDYEIYGPDHLERWETDPGIRNNSQAPPSAFPI